VNGEAIGDDQARRGGRNLLVMTSGRLAIHAVLVVAAFVVPRVLGAESYGRYAAALAVVQILVAFSSFGLPLVEARILAPLWRGDRAEAVTLGSTLWGVRLGLAALVGLAAATWIDLAPALGFGGATAVGIGLLCTARAATEATRSLLLPLGRVGAMIGIELARAVLTVPVVVIAFTWHGLPGVFASLPVVYALLLAAAVALLLRVAPLGPARFRWSALRPHLTYSLSAFVGTLAGVVQSQFAVFAVASWVASREAGFLAFAVQLFAFAQALFQAASRALLPVLAELESRDEARRLARWGGLMMRYAAGAMCILTVGWALLGGPLIGLALGEAFRPAHACGTWMLVAAMLACAGSAANSLLYVRGHGSAASGNLVVYTAATMGGLALALIWRDSDGAALRIAQAYAFASVVFFACAHTTSSRLGSMRLPAGRALLLMAPAALAWPAGACDVDPTTRLAAFAGFSLAYVAAAAGLGLLPRRELRDVARRLRA
jgi:O-antigen/teichoic acid export membrane protein